MMIRSDKRNTDIIKIILAVIVMVFALFVRMPSIFLVAVPDENKEAFTDETGLPYFIDGDSYYHIRLVDTMLKTGKIADTVSPDGVPWDTHSFAPEGRSAVYQPGIVYVTIALWKVFNLSAPIDISRVEYYFPGFMAMITALVAFITGCRFNGRICGFVTGIITGAAPAFVMRTTFGRFDTDIFVLLMNMLLILFMAEILRAKEWKKKIVFALVFVVTAILYTQCWAPQFSTLFTGLTVVGGLIYAVINCRCNCEHPQIKNHIISVFKNREVILLVASGILVLLVIGVTMGFSVVGEVFKSLSFKTTQDASEGVLPNMFESISELEIPAFAPDRFIDWFRGYNLGKPHTVITGVGGLLPVSAAVGGLVILVLGAIGKLKAKHDEIPEQRICLVYSAVLGLWILACVFLTLSGIRFIMMLAVPVGLLAGIFLGWLSRCISYPGMKSRVAGTIVSAVLIGLVLLSDIEGLFLSNTPPSITDASIDAMRMIRENSDDNEGVIESWWDFGYVYECESDHPCLWDGGTQDGARAILFSRAMVENDMEMSARILGMLATSGNKAIDMMMEYTDPKTSFDVLWRVLPMDEQDACDMLSEKCGMSMQDAHKAEEMIHPRKYRESYLVLTYTMMKQTETYEYYSSWDFSGTQISPFASPVVRENEETLTEKQDDLEKELDEKRNSEVMWRLYFELEESPYFIPECESYDGVEGIRVWKVAPI